MSILEYPIAPMKAPSATLTEEALRFLDYPVLVSPKMDGLRALGAKRQLLSKTLAPFRNEAMQYLAESGMFAGMDGELVAGSPSGDDVLRRSYSAFMSSAGEPDWYYWVFDRWDMPDTGFASRYDAAQRSVAAAAKRLGPRVRVMPQYRCDSPVAVLKQEEHALAEGYEGLMVRSMFAPYVPKRCTVKSGYLLKLKRFQDGEALLLYVEEAVSNANEAKVLGDGSTRRGRSAAGRSTGNGLAGSVVGIDTKTGVEVKASTARLTAEERLELLRIADELAGESPLFTYRRFGSGDGAPRFPVFHSLRDASDI